MGVGFASPFSVTGRERVMQSSSQRTARVLLRMSCMRHTILDCGWQPWGRLAGVGDGRMERGIIKCVQPLREFSDRPSAVDPIQVWEELPKPSHNSIPMVGAMRLLIALMIVTSTSGAQAQYPWAYPQYRPSYPLYGGPYAPPAQRLSPVSLSQSMLAAHNAVRSRVGVPSLVWSDQLAEVAQDWANHLIATGSFSHRPDNSYGENLYSISGGTASPAQVVSYWAGEARIRSSEQHLCWRLRPLHADCMGEDPSGWLRRCH